MTGSMLALPRVLGEVAAVLLERLVLLLGVVARDAVAAAHALQRVEHRVVGDADAAEEVADAAGDLGHREQDVLGREVLVVEGRALARRRPRARGTRSAARLRLADGRAADPRPLRQRLVEPGAQRCRASTPMRSSTPLTTPSGWSTQRPQQVLGRDLGVALLARRGLGGAEGLGGLAGEPVGVERHLLLLRVGSSQS